MLQYLLLTRASNVAELHPDEENIFQLQSPFAFYVSLKVLEDREISYSTSTWKNFLSRPPFLGGENEYRKC